MAARAHDIVLTVTDIGEGFRTATCLTLDGHELMVPEGVGITVNSDGVVTVTLTVFANLQVRTVDADLMG